ncbi:MAG: hypothetical protein ACE5ET_04590 [Gammaproteobacteria bacterium]
MMYAYGIGVLRNERHAARWLRKAARAGHPLARRQLEVLWQRAARQKHNKPLPDMRHIRRNLNG